MQHAEANKCNHGTSLGSQSLAPARELSSRSLRQPIAVCHDDIIITLLKCFGIVLVVAGFFHVGSPLSFFRLAFSSSRFCLLRLTALAVLSVGSD
jgi:hypothetical protein